MTRTGLSLPSQWRLLMDAMRIGLYVPTRDCSVSVTDALESPSHHKQRLTLARISWSTWRESLGPRISTRLRCGSSEDSLEDKGSAFTGEIYRRGICSVARDISRGNSVLYCQTLALYRILCTVLRPGTWCLDPPPTTDQGQVRWRLRLVVGGMITDGVKLRRVKLVRGISQSAKASRSFLPVRPDFERFFG
jgi:hypothetical protein